jgi:glyoxylase-like metal-dependent hydrolase (beta-lactamase superfamily II)
VVAARRLVTSGTFSPDGGTWAVDKSVWLLGDDDEILVIDAAHDVVFTGDTLFQGGPGATGGSFSDFPTIIDSIRDRLLTLPPRTTVLTGHGDDTSIADEAPRLDEWIARGH